MFLPEVGEFKKKNVSLGRSGQGRTVGYPRWRPSPLNVEPLQGRRFRDCFGPCQVAVQYMFASVARARPRALPARRECRSKAARVRHLMVDN
eukprot:scaffold145304_cov133-Phaeocystis_antarctica.AAC.1